MSAKVLGRVVSATDQPRGPDAQMSVVVPESWISKGATLEIELPRNLACAGCGGGGCDTCERAGAVSLRARTDAKESVEVTLPKATTEMVDAGKARAIVLRIPQKGGMASSGSELPRGNLLLTIRPGEEAGVGVKRLPGPSIRPPHVAPELVGLEKPEKDLGLVWLFVIAALSALLAWLLAR
jgi:hypothetical protein